MNDPKSQPMFERCRDLEDKPDGPDRLSAIEASEIACKSARCALATGSLPVSSAEALCRDWKAREDAQRSLAEEKGERFSASGDMRHTYAADALKLCHAMLRRQIVAASKRQPEENTTMSQPGGQS